MSGKRWAIRKQPQSKSGLPVQPREVAMPDLTDLFDRSANAARSTVHWTIRTARLMIGVPDYETYVAHRRANHPDQPIIAYVEFFRECQPARYGVGKGPSRGCC